MGRIKIAPNPSYSNSAGHSYTAKPLSLLGDSCTLMLGLNVCVQVNFHKNIRELDKSKSYHNSTWSLTYTDIISTQTQTPVATPMPIGPGMVECCTAFHLVESRDACTAMAGDAGVLLADFVTMNPDVDFAALVFAGLLRVYCYKLEC
jgi:hypothetical protein